jgi:hypothetical protein
MEESTTTQLTFLMQFELCRRARLVFIADHNEGEDRLRLLIHGRQPTLLGSHIPTAELQLLFLVALLAVPTDKPTTSNMYICSRIRVQHTNTNEMEVPANEKFVLSQNRKFKNLNYHTRLIFHRRESP